MSKVLFDRVVIDEVVVKEEVSEGGIILTKTNDDVTYNRVGRGTVYLAGDACVQVKAKQTVQFDKAQTVPISIKGKDYLIIRENYIYIIE